MTDTSYPKFCTCLCPDCLAGHHCGGYDNQFGYCTFPPSLYSIAFIRHNAESDDDDECGEYDDYDGGDEYDYEAEAVISSDVDAACRYAYIENILYF